MLGLAILCRHSIANPNAVRGTSSSYIKVSKSSAELSCTCSRAAGSSKSSRALLNCSMMKVWLIASISNLFKRSIVVIHLPLNARPAAHFQMRHRWRIWKSYVRKSCFPDYLRPRCTDRAKKIICLEHPLRGAF